MPSKPPSLYHSERVGWLVGWYYPFFSNETTEAITRWLSKPQPTNDTDGWTIKQSLTESNRFSPQRFSLSLSRSTNFRKKRRSLLPFFCWPFSPSP